MPQLPETAWFELVPDWVCEILSPSTTRDDRVVKMPLYAREGVAHIWLIDPDQKTLEVYVLQDERWLLLGAHKDDEQVSPPPFEALELELSALWP
jgi:Uma2 family endonuclease